MNSKLTKFFGIITLLSISLVSTARSEGFTFSVGKFDHNDNKTDGEAPEALHLSHGWTA